MVEIARPDFVQVVDSLRHVRAGDVYRVERGPWLRAMSDAIDTGRLGPHGKPLFRVYSTNAPTPAAAQEVSR